jgi:2,3-bisphosphoglycerate-independent phosphoglycerate mutase
MSQQLKTRGKADERVVLIVLDGWGIAPPGKWNAISQARTPNFDSVSREFGSIEVCASGRCVGLSEGQMGNSEVGHLTIGAGRIIFQDLMRVNEEVSSGRLARNPGLLEMLSRVKRRGSALHFLGLLSDGGVHSHIQHLYALLKIAKDLKIDPERTYVHVILDGRDTPPKSGIDYVASLQSYLGSLSLGSIATISGRYYAMDRDNRWDRTKLAYDAIVYGEAKHHFSDPLVAVKASYEEGVNDEFVVPRVIGSYKGMKDSDAVVFFNFRPDRARQMTKALVLPQKEFGNLFDRREKSRPKKLELLTMTVYDRKLRRVVAILKPERVLDTLGNVLEKNGIRQLRVAETEKYAHVTYFFNGLVEKPRKFEDRILVPSRREVGTYDRIPEMSARQITAKSIEAIESGKYGFILINFANADMVGHSGNVEATVKAVETVDSCLGKLFSLWRKKSAGKLTLIITADHGNAEKMFDESSGQPHTAHTSNPVPLVVLSETWKLSENSKKGKPELSDIAPSILEIMNLRKPRAMDGSSLVARK